LWAALCRPCQTIRTVFAVKHFYVNLPPYSMSRKDTFYRIPEWEVAYAKQLRHTLIEIQARLSFVLTLRGTKLLKHVLILKHVEKHFQFRGTGIKQCGKGTLIERDW